MSNGADEVLGTSKRSQNIAELEDAIAQLQDDRQYLMDELERYKVALSGGQAGAGLPPPSKDERFLDRVIGQRLGDNQHASGHELWITRTQLVEILALLNISAKDYRKFCRDWEDIQTLSQGGGNQEIVKARQERLFFRLQLYRSRGDNPVSGYTERSAHFTQKQEVDQTVKMPQAREQGGFSFTDIFKKRRV